MSRPFFILGLIASTLIHLYVLSIGPMADPNDAPKPAPTTAAPVEVVPVEVAKIDPPPPTPEPTPELQPKIEPEPAPEPKVEPKPEPKPAPVEVKPQPGEAPKPEPKPLPPAPVEPPRPQVVEKPKPAPETPPAAPLREIAEAKSARITQRGSFAGSTEASDGPHLPHLMIDWGAHEQAMRILAAGRMKLVILESADDGSRVNRQVSLDAARPTIHPLSRDEAAAYSNRLRVVRNVTAFRPVARQLPLKRGEDLAVAMPVDVEHMLDRAQKFAAYDRRLSYLDVDHFKGRFVLNGSQLSFHITHVQPRSSIQ